MYCVSDDDIGMAGARAHSAMVSLSQQGAGDTFLQVPGRITHGTASQVEMSSGGPGVRGWCVVWAQPRGQQHA